jgi:DNA-binding transcriptional LysR family regulator
LPYASEIVALTDKAAVQVRQIESGFIGHISIAALTSCSAIMFKCLKLFTEKYPDVMIETHFCNTRAQREFLDDKCFDLYFSIIDMMTAGEIYDYFVTDYDRLGVIMSPSH